MNETDITIRNISTIDEIHAVEELQRQTWGGNDVTPMTNLVASIEVGAILIGAFDGEKMVGFIYGFVGQYHNEFEIHSHMLAVNPEYRSHKLGEKLKWAQREEALAKGFKKMSWTFDPLQSVNAHLNLHKLGCIADEYKINYYGEGEQNELHRGIGTDRLWVTWLLDSDHVIAKSNQEVNDSSLSQDAFALIEFNDDGKPACVLFDETISASHLLIDIPRDILKLREENLPLALDWRTATRKAFTKAFSVGYYVTDYIRNKANREIGGSFVLKPKESPFR
jgi:predicted GNAT superfamily acetyltransferase